jgi:adenylate cyclase
MQRRLAAIVSADVQGYSRLMGEDEAATVRILTAYREVMSALIREHGGRVVDTPGDNLLAEFPSAVEAVQSAIAIQDALGSRNAALAPDRRMEFRIGINLGDVLAEGERIYGDGVNIAARVQDLAEAGGICISGSTYDQVENKLAIVYEFLGEHLVKNIAKPVRAYKLRMPEARGLGTPPQGGLTPPMIPSIAVLPFDNMSTDSAQEYFSDGITEDLITDLSKLPGLFVIARNSTFTYKGKAVKVQQVGRELGVRYVLEGSVRKAGDRVRITGQLVDASTGHHLWADRYDRQLDDVFAVQDEITRNIVDALAVRLTGLAQQSRQRRRTGNVEAYDMLLRGADRLRQTTREANLQARQLFEKAIALDPDYAEAHALLANTHFRDWSMGWSQDVHKLEWAREEAERALSLSDDLPVAHRMLAVVLLWMKQHERALKEAERAVALAPSDADGHWAVAEVLSWWRPAEAIAPIDKAIRLNPYYPPTYLYTKGHAYYLTRCYEDAIRELRRVVSRNPDFLPAHALLSATYAELGRLDDARAEMLETKRISPEISTSTVSTRLPYENSATMTRFIDAVRAAGSSDT